MNSSSVALIGFAILPVALGAIVGGFAEQPDRSGIRPVTVTATDYALQAPDTIAAGAVTFRLINQGKEFHHLWVARLDQGKTAADLLAAMRQPGPLPAWVREVGGPNAPTPGGESNATLSLRPGSYVLACLIPSGDGIPHLMKGMVHSLTVVDVPLPAPDPVGDVTLTLHDYSFALTSPLTAGRHLIQVHNNGPSPTRSSWCSSRRERPRGKCWRGCTSPRDRRRDYRWAACPRSAAGPRRGSRWTCSPAGTR